MKNIKDIYIKYNIRMQWLKTFNPLCMYTNNNKEKWGKNWENKKRWKN